MFRGEFSEEGEEEEEKRGQRRMEDTRVEGGVSRRDR